MANGNFNAAFSGENYGSQIGHNSGHVVNNYHIVRDGTFSMQGPRPRPQSTVPFRRDDNFVDTGILDRIHRKCAPPAARVALVGLGGIGKSQLAIEYSYRLRKSSPETWVFWVHASSTARIEEGYHRIAEAIKLPGRDDPKVNILQLVRAWLCDESNGEWTVIVDNADDSSQIADLSGEILPESSNGTVLVTSRSQEAARELVGDEENIIKIEPMAEDHALALFRKRLQDDVDCEESLELLRQLDYMPLAISQAGAYIKRKAPRITIAKYLEAFQQSEQDKTSLLNQAVRDRRRDGTASHSILTTWQISFEHIRKDRTSAARLLSLMSMFDRQGIPRDLVAPQYGKRDRVRKFFRIDEPPNFDEDVELLRTFSLIGTGADQDIFEMHRLVQFATREWMKQRKELEEWKETYIMAMANAFPDPIYENWKECQRLFPHAELALNYRPASQSTLLKWAAIVHKAAFYASTQRSYPKAEQMNRQALAARERVLGKKDPYTLHSLHNLADSLWHQDKHEEAEQIYRQTIDRKKQVLGKEHPDTLTSLSNLAISLQNQDKCEEAEEMHRGILDVRIRVRGKEHPDTLVSLDNLADSLWHQDKYEEAEQIYRQAMDNKKRVLGKEHPDTLLSLSNLAIALQNQGKYGEAEEMHRQTLDIRERVLEKEHPDTRTSLNNLASVLRDQGKYEEAEHAFRRVLISTEQVLGKEHPTTLRGIFNLANLLCKRREYLMAKPLYEKALAGFEKVLGSDHPHTRNCSRVYSDLQGILKTTDTGS